MPRHLSASQFKSKLRQAEQKQRRAINDYNQAVRKYNLQVKKAIDAHKNGECTPR